MAARAGRVESMIEMLLDTDVIIDNIIEVDCEGRRKLYD